MAGIQKSFIAFDTQTVVNVASVPHRSPFRYPGGKTWLVPHVRSWLQCIRKPAYFAEPFAGGGIVGLSALFDGLCDQLILIELDENVAAVWRTILNHNGKALAEKIVRFEVSMESVRSVLNETHRTLFDRAFATIIKNRMQRGGIMAPGASLMKDGENGKGLLSRWYAHTLQKRIFDIIERKKRIQFVQGDGVAFIRQNLKRKDMVFFIDPPYTVAGRRLYKYSELDHDALFNVAAQAQGDILMTYDNTENIRELAAKHGFDIEAVVMKNTHHAVMSELLIGRDLSWART